MSVSRTRGVRRRTGGGRRVVRSGAAPLEAALSEQIGNLTASARAIFSAELGVRRSHNEEEIAFSTRAMRAALEFANSLSADAILDMHRVLMAGQPRHTPGQWRDEPVWIGTRFAPPPDGRALGCPRARTHPGAGDGPGAGHEQEHRQFTGHGGSSARPVRDHPSVQRRQRVRGTRSGAGHAEALARYPQ